MYCTMSTIRTVSRPALSTRSARRVVVRASADTEAPKDNASSTTPQSSTVFYAGNSYNEGQWAEAVKSGKVSPAPAAPDASEFDSGLSIGEAMSFSGPAPELINGRLAMIGFISALGAELGSGESVLRQLADEPTGIVLTFILFSAATLIPLLNSTKREAFGPFTPEAETLNSRAAMIGFAIVLASELLTGKAFF
eukprot:jgi/Picsp_1/6225/NSC_03579-R1_early light induced chloroplast precursor